MSAPHSSVMQKHACEPANGIIEQLGGVTNVAKILNKDASTIRRWRMPRPDGTGGMIPDPDKIALIDAARKIGIEISWRSFAPPKVRDFA